MLHAALDTMYVQGDLRRAVRGRCFADCPRRSAHLGLRAAVYTAREVALGMLHLHSVGGHHGNLTPLNVLLLESHTDRRGFVAKVRTATPHGRPCRVQGCVALSG